MQFKSITVPTNIAPTPDDRLLMLDSASSDTIVTVPISMLPGNGVFGVTPEQYGALGDGIANDTQAFRDADTAAGLAGTAVLLGPKDYMFRNLFSTDSGGLPYYVPKASWFGVPGRTRVILGAPSVNVPQTPGGPLPNFAQRYFRFHESRTNPGRAARYGTVSPQTPIALLTAPQNASRSRLIVTDPTEYTNLGLAAGDNVHVAWGVCPFDSDDDLYRYDQVHPVGDVDPVNHHIYLSDAVDLALPAGIMFPGSPANVAVDWVAGLTIAVGDFIWQGNSLFQASTAGNTAGTGVADDSGVTWHRITMSQGARARLQDDRPTVQKALWLPQRLVWRDILFDTEPGVVGLQGLLDIKGAHDLLFQDIEVRGNIELFGSYVGEGSRRIVFRRVRNRSLPGLTGTAANRGGLKVYSSRQILFDDCEGVAGPWNSAAGDQGDLLNIESGAHVIVRNSRIQQRDQGSSYTNTFIQQGELEIDGGEYSSGSSDLRCGLYSAPFPWATQHLQQARRRNARITMNSSAAFRCATWSDTESHERVEDWFHPSNRFLINSGYATGAFIQARGVEFRPKGIVTLQASFVPAVSQVNTGLEFFPTDVPYGDIPNPRTASFIVLGAWAWWDTPGTVGDLDIRLKSRMSIGGTTERGVFSTVEATNRLLLAVSTPGRVEKWASDGGGHRMVQGAALYPDGVGEGLYLRYYSGTTPGPRWYIGVRALWA